VGGITIVAVNSSPISRAEEASAAPGHAVVTDSTVAGAPVAVGTVAGGVTVVAVHSGPSSITGEARAVSGYPELQIPFSQVHVILQLAS